MSACAQTLGISYKFLKRVTLRSFPELWQPDLSGGTSRLLNLNEPEVRKQAKIIAILKKSPKHTKFGHLKVAVQKFNMQRKRYLALYDRVTGDFMEELLYEYICNPNDINFLQEEHDIT